MHREDEPDDARCDGRGLASLLVELRSPKRTHMSSRARTKRPSLVRLLPLIALPFACGNPVPEPAGTGGVGGISENCGKEFEMCCTASSVRACEAVPDLRCNDSACVICSHVPALEPGCTNVARNAKTTADKTERNDTANRGAQLAVDGDACTYWSSGDLPSDATKGTTQTSWQVDLGAAKAIDNLTLWLAMTPAGAVNLQLQYGNDGTHWQTEWSGTRDMSGAEPWTYPLAQRTTARYFRVVFLASPSWAAIRELQLFDCAKSGPTDGGSGDARP